MGRDMNTWIGKDWLIRKEEATKEIISSTTQRSTVHKQHDGTPRNTETILFCNQEKGGLVIWVVDLLIWIVHIIMNREGYHFSFMFDIGANVWFWYWAKLQINVYINCILPHIFILTSILMPELPASGLHSCHVVLTLNKWKKALILLKLFFFWQNVSAFQLEGHSFLFVAPGRLFFILMPTQTLEGRRTTRSADIFSFVALNRTRREHTVLNIKFNIINKEHLQNTTRNTFPNSTRLAFSTVQGVPFSI